MRTAGSYTIYVDLPENQQEIARWLHGYTGAYDRVSRPVASFLRSREAKRAPRAPLWRLGFRARAGRPGDSAYVAFASKPLESSRASAVS